VNRGKEGNIMKKLAALVTGIILLGSLAGGLTAALASNAASEDPVAPMTAEEAMSIAADSACTAGGWFTGNAFYNEGTGTWWLDLDVEKEGCSPACVVYVATGEVELNWRCTGALPPADGVQGEGVQAGVPLLGSTSDALLPE
jgi:hypothetical protein